MIRSLEDEHGRLIQGQAEMWEAFYENFNALFGMGRTLDHMEVIEVLSECPKGKSPGLNGLLYEFYKSMLDMFRNILAHV